MPETITPPAEPLASSALRIVLFGMPDAGKTSLLGALAQAAQVQDHVLQGRLHDRSKGLLELQRRLYEDRPRETLEEVTAYPIVLEPLGATPSPLPLSPEYRGEGKDSSRTPLSPCTQGPEYRGEGKDSSCTPLSPCTQGERGRGEGAAGEAMREAVLIDCDGRLANDLLSRPVGGWSGDRPPTGRAGNSALARAILGADTLVLVVDASASAETMRRDFGQFDRFLHLLEQHRGRRTEVGGLPVYLVLTKCDLIARHTDTTVAWMERIEERKRQVDAEFKEFFASQAGQAPVAFGRVALHLWATAVKRPALADAPAKPREPYGVAELFRQCLDSAAAFRQRRARAADRLRLMLGGVLGMIAVMLLLILYFVATRPDRETSALENEIRAFRSVHDRPAELFKEPVEERIKRLNRFQHDADFARLPVDLKDYVTKTLSGLNAYQRYNKEFLDRVPDPRYARGLEELDKIEADLQQLPLPSAHEAEWTQTRAGQRRRQWQQDVEVLRREVNAAIAKLTDLLRRSQRLADESISLGEYRKLRDELLREDERLRYRESERDRFLPGSSRLTYGNVMQFERVENLWRDWQQARRKMKAAS